MNSSLILLVEEDAKNRAFLHEELAADGYDVVQAHSRQHALALLGHHEADLVLADANGETLWLLDAIRAGEGVGGRLDPNTPMIVLTSRADELARVRVFDHEGDDVVTKPFSYPELRGRIRALLRRSQNQHKRPILRIGSLRVDLGSREVHVDGQPVALTPKEFDLLAALAKQPTRVLSNKELLREVWGYAAECRTRTVQTHAHRLRRKLSAAGAERPFVVGVWGVGYRLTDHAPQRAAA